jgi:ATP-binding cassette subfamily B protein
VHGFHFDFGEAPKGVKLERNELLRIGRYLLPAWRPTLLIVLCILMTSVLGLIPPLLIREVIDKAIPSKDVALLSLLVVGMIAAPLLGGLIGVLQSWLVTQMGQRVMFDLRNEMYARLLAQSLRFFTETKSGEIQSRIQNDVGGVQGVITGTMVSLVTNTLVFVTTLVVILRIDWKLALIAVVVLPLFILPTRRVGQLRKRISKETQERLAELTAMIQESLSINGYLLVGCSARSSTSGAASRERPRRSAISRSGRP